MAPARVQTLADVLKGNSEALGVVCAGGGPVYNRGQLEVRIKDLASLLRNSGIKPGDTVSIAKTNTVDFIVGFLGVTYARAVAAPLNPNYKLDEFKFFMEDAKSKLLLVPSEGNPTAEKAAIDLHVPIATLKLTSSGVEVTPKSKGFQVKQGSAELVDAPKPEDVALFLHTSGTTSRPKGVPLSQGNLAASLANIIATYELGPEDRSLVVMPLFHVHGLMAGLLAPLAAGGAVIIPAGGKFSATTHWRDAVEHQATFYTAVPTMHQVLLARASKDYPADSPPPLRFIRSCSSSLAAATLHKLEAAFKVPVLEAYAMTEASHQMTSNPLPKHGPHKPGTVGRAQGSVKVATLDQHNKATPPGKIGEVCIQGPNVTKGYLNRPEANEEAFAGGWFHTGDQGFLDEEGFLTLTGRIKELINRGGEKISPIEVDGVLMSHPQVAEAVAFACPDEKYGEIVAAAVVPNKPVSDTAAFAKDLQKLAGQKMAAFKVPVRIFVTKQLPKTATGKIQRRMMVEHFIKGPGQQEEAGKGASDASATGGSSSKESSASNNGFSTVAQTLARLGIKHMYGVVGIPVTELASAAQAVGIRFIGFRNEQAAGYAAAACGYLTGVPGVLLTVSGPGAVHGIAGLSHAAINCWPMIMLSGSSEQNELGKGAFQELDQVKAVQQFCKYAGSAASAKDIVPTITAALKAAVSGRPGASYVGVPSNILFGAAPADAGEEGTARLHIPALGPNRLLRERGHADGATVQAAAQLLSKAQRPLIVIGKGAAQSYADSIIRRLVDEVQIPVLSTSMGRGVVPDNHPLSVIAARSLALAKADVVLVMGARLNWQLHFGEAPKWSSSVKFILADVAPGQRDVERAALSLTGDAGAIAAQLTQALPAAHGFSADRYQAWRQQLADKVTSAKAKLEKSVSGDAFPLDYQTSMRVIRDALHGVSPPPVVVSEGANTMDNARLILEPAVEGRLRLDAGTWGTMGVGLGYAIAAATCTDRLVVAVEGDSAFGFSGMEVETMARYQLPVVVIIMNNSGIYGGDRRQQQLREAAHKGATAAGFGDDPEPTSFVPNAKYHMMMEAFGGQSYDVNSSGSLAAACRIAFNQRRPTVINVQIDPMAGVESGNVHSFNAPKAKV
ncbi:hypothetical protein ABBQ38_003493 [Trebouxia sp. C0009 RCD-2024]